MGPYYVGSSLIKEIVWVASVSSALLVLPMQHVSAQAQSSSWSSAMWRKLRIFGDKKSRASVGVAIIAAVSAALLVGGCS